MRYVTNSRTTWSARPFRSDRAARAFCQILNSTGSKRSAWATSHLCVAHETERLSIHGMAVTDVASAPPRACSRSSPALLLSFSPPFRLPPTPLSLPSLLLLAPLSPLSCTFSPSAPFSSPCKVARSTREIRESLRLPVNPYHHHALLLHPCRPGYPCACANWTSRHTPLMEAVWTSARVET